MNTPSPLRLFANRFVTPVLKRRLSAGLSVSLWAGLLSAGFGIIAGVPGTSMVSHARSTGGIVNVVSVGEPQLLNPVFEQSPEAMTLYDLIYAGLIRQTPRGELQADLLTQVPTAANGGVRMLPGGGMVVNYTLRNDLFWQDGQPITTADIIFTWQANTDPRIVKVANTGYEKIQRVEPISDREINVYFYAPYGEYFQLFKYLLPRHAFRSTYWPLDRNHPYNRNPIGAGPFRLKEWKMGQSALLEANPYYHRTRAQLDQVRYQFKPKGYTSFKQAAEWANDAHIMRGLGLASYDYLKDRNDLTLDVVRTGEIEHLLFNLDNPILADRRVRRALAYATDRKEIRKLLLGLGDNAFSDQIKASWKYAPQTESYYPFSVTTAANQLGFAGWTLSEKEKGEAAAPAPRPRGEEPLVLDLTLEQGNRSHAVIGRYLQNAWKAVGVDLRLKFVAPRILQAEVLPRRDYMLTFSTWHEDGRETPYLRWHSTQKAPEGLNYSGFSDYQVDVVTQALQKTVDINEQKRLYGELSQLLAEELPALPLYYGVELEAHKKSLQNFEPNQQASLGWNSADWWLK